LITIQHIQERLCAAYVEAVAGVAGVNLAATRRNDYGIDGTFQPVVVRGSRRVESGFPIDFQAKATIDWQFRDNAVVYDLEVKTYNDLVTRHPAASRCVLVLLCLPRDRRDWILAVEEWMLLRRCCYWLFVEGAVSENSETQRVFIPRANLLTGATLCKLLHDERKRRLAL
jgi:hypothetical protein